MKATGIVRRIDDLGRLVIPKEIRRTMRIHEGDPFEIYIDDECVCFRKYSMLNDIEKEKQHAMQALKECGILCALYDNNGTLVSGTNIFNGYVPMLFDSFPWLDKEKEVAVLPITVKGLTYGYLVFRNNDKAVEDMVLLVAKMLEIALS